jgi:hypothetical protein
VRASTDATAGTSPREDDKKKKKDGGAGGSVFDSARDWGKTGPDEPGPTKPEGDKTPAPASS